MWTPPITPASWYYRAHRRDDTALRRRLRELAQARPRFAAAAGGSSTRSEIAVATVKLIEVDFTLTGANVVNALERVAKQRGYPRMMTVDNGSEFA